MPSLVLFTSSLAVAPAPRYGPGLRPTALPASARGSAPGLAGPAGLADGTAATRKPRSRAVGRLEPAAVRRPAERRRDARATAPDHAVVARFSTCGIFGTVGKVGGIPVVAPLVQIPMHVEQASQVRSQFVPLCATTAPSCPETTHSPGATFDRCQSRRRSAYLRDRRTPTPLPWAGENRAGPGKTPSDEGCLPHPWAATADRRSTARIPATPAASSTTDNTRPPQTS